MDFVITEKQFSPIIGLNGIIANLNTNVTDLKKQIIEKLILLELVPVGSSPKIIRLREKNQGNAGKI